MFLSDLGKALGVLPSLSFLTVQFLLNDPDCGLLEDCEMAWAEESVYALSNMVGGLTKLESLEAYLSFWGNSPPSENAIRCLCSLWTSIGRLSKLSALKIKTRDSYIGVSDQCLATALGKLNWLTTLALDLDTVSGLSKEGAGSLGRSLGSMGKLTSLSLLGYIQPFEVGAEYNC